MTPKILDYTDGNITITLEAYTIKELNDIIQRWGDEAAKPYLAFVHLKSHPESPYINLPTEEIDDTIKYDIVQALGDFDETDDLIQPAIERLTRQFITKAKRYYDSLGVLMDRISAKAMDAEIVTEGKDANLSEFNRMIERAGNALKSYKEVEKTVDDEIRTKMKGKSTLGEY